MLARQRSAAALRVFDYIQGLHPSADAMFLLLLLLLLRVAG